MEGNRNVVVERNICTIAYNILYNIKSDRQFRYEPIILRHRQQDTLHHIGMGLAILLYSRERRLINLVGAPGYSYAIPYPKIIRYETALANAVIENIKKNGNVYVPFGLQNGNVYVPFGLQNGNVYVPFGLQKDEITLYCFTVTG